MHLTFQKKPRELSKAGQHFFSLFLKRLKSGLKIAAAQMHQIRQIAYVWMRKSKTAVRQH